MVKLKTPIKGLIKKRLLDDEADLASRPKMHSGLGWALQGPLELSLLWSLQKEISADLKGEDL